MIDIERLFMAIIGAILTGALTYGFIKLHMYLDERKNDGR